MQVSKTPRYASTVAKTRSSATRMDQSKVEAGTSDSVTLSSEKRQGVLSCLGSKGLLRNAGLALMLGLAIANPLTAAFASPANLPQPPAATQVLQQNGEREILYTRQDFNGPTQVQQQSDRPSRGVRFDYTRAEMDAAVRNTVTASEMQDSDWKFTAFGVDAQQSSKLYHDSRSLAELGDGYGTVRHNNPVLMCMKENRAGDACQSAIRTDTSHSVLSCVYRNETDGGLYRVLHRADSHQQTNAMQRNVCGGHELVRSSGSWAPAQSTENGELLFLNPGTIISIQSVTPAEAARYGG